MDVEFTLKVVRDPLARQKLKQWENELLQSQEQVGKKRKEHHQRTEEDINRVRGLAVQREIQAQKRAEEEGRRALHRRRDEYVKMKREESRAAERTEREKTAIARRAERERRALEKQAEQERLQALARERRAMEANSAVMRRMARMARQNAGWSGGGGGGGGGDGGMGGLGAAFLGSRLGSGGMGSLLRMGARFAGPAAVVGMGWNAVNQYSEFEANRLQMGAMFGSNDRADQMIGQFRQLGQFGIDQSMLNQVATMMAGFGMTADEITQQLQNMAVITGGASDRLSRLAVQFAQMHQMGVLYTEDMKIMAEAGFNPLTQISKDTGLSVAELRKQMEEGQISAKMVAEAFTRAAESSNRLDVMMGSTRQTLGSFSSEMNQLMIAIGQKIVETGAVELAGTAGAWTAKQARVGLTGGAWLDFRGQNENAIKTWEQFGRESAFASWTEDDIKLQKSLDEQIAKHKERLAAIEKAGQVDKEAADEVKAKEQERIKAIAAGQAKELANAQKIADLRRKAIDDEIKGRQEVVKLAQEEREDARKALMSARERFGAMSEEEQRNTIKTVIKARTQGVGALSLEEIDTLKTLGTGEANRLASQALLNRSRGGFGSEYQSQVQSLQARESALQRERAKIIAGAGGDPFNPVHGRGEWTNDEMFGPVRGGAKFTDRERARLSQIDRELNSVRSGYGAAEDQARQRFHLRESLFGDERQTLRRAMRKEAMVQADVKQTIEFKASFEKSAREIADQVLAMVANAAGEEGKEIMKHIRPALTAVQNERRRRAANVPGRRV